jgi:hypothetical protein
VTEELERLGAIAVCSAAQLHASAGIPARNGRFAERTISFSWFTVRVGSVKHPFAPCRGDLALGNLT